MRFQIRVIEPDDISTVVEMIREFAAFESLSEYCEITTERLALAMFGPRGVVEGLIAFEGEVAAGYALFFPNFSSFRGQRGFYLDDIYIRAPYRGHGLGEAILSEIARIATANGYERIDFLVLQDNAPAIGFYEKLGAEAGPGEYHYKFSGEALKTLSDRD